MTEEQLNIINYLTEDEYQKAKTNGTINENELYITPNDSARDIINYIDGEVIATNDYINGKRVYSKRLVTNAAINTANNFIVSIQHKISNYDEMWIDISNSHMYANKKTDNYICLPVVATAYATNSTDEISATIVGNDILIISNASWGTNWTKVVTIKFTYNN